MAQHNEDRPIGKAVELLQSNGRDRLAAAARCPFLTQRFTSAPFLPGLKHRGLHGLWLQSSDAHEGLKAARKAAFPGVPWQR